MKLLRLLPARRSLGVVGCLFAAIAICLQVGCNTPTPPPPVPQEPMQLTVAPRPMLTSGSAPYGNEYTISAVVHTNGRPWPDPALPVPRRVHLQLSTDGGSNYTRTLAYGIPTAADGSVSYTYSLPWWDESLVTERARLRITDLEGTQIGHSLSDFTIAGLFWHTPAAGSVLTHGTQIELEWVQAGCGSSATLGWITPSEPHTVITTITNLVAGTNNLIWTVTGVPYPREEIKLVLQSTLCGTNWAATGVLSSE